MYLTNKKKYKFKEICINKIPFPDNLQLSKYLISLDFKALPQEVP